MANISVSYFGLSNVLEHFDKQKNPFWKVYLSTDARSVLSTNFDVPDFSKSKQLLRDVISNVNGSNVYTLETYKNLESKKSNVPDTSVTFMLSEQKMNGTPAEYEPQKYDSNAMKDKIELIHQNAALISEIGILKFQIDFLQRENLALKSNLVDLETELNNANADLDDIEEEEEKESVGTMQSAIAGLIQKHGAEIIGSFVASKAVKEKLSPEVKISGFNDANDKSGNYTLQQLLTELDKADKHLHYHLYKLVLISQQQPDLFKLFMDKLDNM